MANNLIIVRHGQAYKNLKNIDGGSGSDLTLQGIKEINEFSSHIIDLISFKDENVSYSLFGDDKPQVVQSAALIQKNTGGSFQILRGLEGIKLGTIAGKSRNEIVEDTTSDISGLRREWHSCNISAKQLSGLVGNNLEDINSFIERVTASLEIVLDSKSDVSIIVATRSIMILIDHVLTNQYDINYDPAIYYHKEYSNGSFLIFNKDNERRLKAT